MTALVSIDGFTGPGRLYRLQPAGEGAPVLIAHGTFSTAETCLPIAQFFAARGRPVYVVEWRNRDGAPGAFDAHDLAEVEIASALRQMPAPAHLVAHSGGGLAMSFAMLDPELRRRTRSLTLLASQGTHLRDTGPRIYHSTRAIAWACQKRGYWPSRLFGLGPCNETAMLLSQWVRFNRQQRITTREGQDLFELLPALSLPVLGIAGVADTRIAPPSGCKALAEAFGPTGQFHLAAAQSDGEDFTHSRLFRSRAATRLLWPRIAQFQNAVEAG